MDPPDMLAGPPRRSAPVRGPGSVGQLSVGPAQL